MDNSWTPAPEDADTKLGNMRSEFTQKADEIKAQVQSSDGRLVQLITNVNGIYSNIETLDGNVGRLEVTANEVKAEVDDARGNASSLSVRIGQIESKVVDENGQSIIEQTATSIRQEVTDKTTGKSIINSINAETGEALIQAEHINLTGAVTISSLGNDLSTKINDIKDLANESDNKISSWCSENDTTYIDGAKIYTGSITASQINVDDIFAQDINATGTIAGAKFVGATGDFYGDIICNGRIEIQNNESGVCGEMYIEKRTISNGIFNIDFSIGDIISSNSARQVNCFVISNENGLYIDGDSYCKQLSSDTITTGSIYASNGYFRDIHSLIISAYSCSVEETLTANNIILDGVNVKESLNGKADKTIQAVTVSGVSESTYSTSVTTNTRAIPSLCLVILNEQVTLTLSSAVTAGTTINLGTISSYKPGANVAVTIWQNSKQARRYMGVLTNKGVIEMKSNMDMSAGTYYIYITATYIW